MFVAGKLPSDIYQQLNNNFGKLPIHARTSVEITHPIVRATEKKYNIINDANGVQAAIRIARPSINRLHPDFTKAQVLNTIFGGFFGSRLMSNIREDKGYTYGIHSFFQNHLSESAWMISTEAGKDVLEATIKEVYYEMQVLREELVEDDELLLVKNYLIGTVLGDLDGPFQIIGRWKNIILNNLTGAYFDNSIQTIKDITPKDIQEMAEKYLKPEEFYELVVV
jgi:predicted Zn-dependent peptidase